MNNARTIGRPGRLLDNAWIRILLLVALLLLISVLLGQQLEKAQADGRPEHTAAGPPVKLPAPLLTGKTAVEEALSQRRSVRDFSGDSIRLEDVSQLLWAAQGVTSPEGGRTAPSAGALYPLEVYLVSDKVKGLPAGVFHYQPAGHALEPVSEGDVQNKLYRAALMQGSIKRGAAVLVITAVFSRTTAKYRERGNHYVYMEAGHAAQNICLQVIPLGLGTVTVGAFDDAGVSKTLGLPETETPLYLLPVGKKE